MRGYILLVLLILAGYSEMKAQSYAHEINEKLGRGINLGNTFEAPRDNSWGMTLSNDDIANIANQGFSHVRIPIRWNDYAAANPPYTIESWFIDTIQKVVDAALNNEMLAMINIHHYDGYNDNPESDHLNRFLAIWKQISVAFKDYPDSLLFEFMNEPHGNLVSSIWNSDFKQVLDTVRKDNPTRICVVGPPDWNSVNSVNKLNWTTDTNMILTVHYYHPFQFTHQGAGWVGDQSQNWLGTTWDSTLAQRNAVINDFEDVRTFSETHNVPVHVGEFGAYSAADDESRRKWTAFCARTFESFGFSWAYWEYQAGFGAYDPAVGTWNNFLLYALTERIDPNSIPLEPWEVRNGSFTNELKGWNFQTSGDAVAAGDVQNEIGVFDISAADGTSWHVQLMQSELSLIQGGEYRVSFDAWTDDPGMSITSYMGMSNDPFSTYTDYSTYTLTTNKQRFNYEFTMEAPSDPNARLVFNLGYGNGILYLDSIRIEQLFIPVLVDELVVDPDTSEITLKGDSINLSVTALPAEANNKEIQWSLILGSNLAEVTQEGVVKAFGNADGKVIAEASALDGSGTKGSAVIFVKNQLQVEEILLTPTKEEIDTYMGSLRIFYDVLPANASNTDLEWAITEGSEMAEITQSGFFSALGSGDGDVIVKASSVDGSGVFSEVKIKLSNQVLAEEVTVSASEKVINVLQGSLQMNAQIYPENASQKEVSWKVTEGETKATIDQSGLLTASGYGNGLVLVRASAIDGSGEYDEMEVTLSNQNSGMEANVGSSLRTWVEAGRLFVQYPRLKYDAKLVIYSIHGRMMKEVNLFRDTDIYETDVTGYVDGVYFIRIMGSGKSFAKRIVIE